MFYFLPECCENWIRSFSVAAVYKMTWQWKQSRQKLWDTSLTFLTEGYHTNISLVFMHRNMVCLFFKVLNCCRRTRKQSRRTLYVYVFTYAIFKTPLFWGQYSCCSLVYRLCFEFLRGNKSQMYREVEEILRANPRSRISKLYRSYIFTAIASARAVPQPTAIIANEIRIETTTTTTRHTRLYVLNYSTMASRKSNYPM